MAGKTMRRGDEGFTVIELLIAIVVSSIILGAVGTAFVAALNGTQDLHERFVESHDAQMLSTYFTSDVQSADPDLLAAAAATAAATPTGCGLADGTNRLHMQWTEEEGGTVKAFSASYRLVGSSTGSQLIRYFCIDGAASSHVVAHNLSDPAVVEPVTVTVRSSGGTASGVEMALVSLQTEDEAAPYRFNLAAATRTPGATSSTSSSSSSSTSSSSTTSSTTTTTTAPDTTPPPAPHNVAGTSPANNRVVLTFEDAEAGVTFECRYESDAFSACTSPKAYPTTGGNSLYDGSHTYGVRAKDLAGNLSAITTITVVGQ